jgi:nitrate reductase gamma subunit
MDLLDFARGPAINAAIAIMVFGVLWRLLALVLLGRAPDRTVPRVQSRGFWPAAFRENLIRMAPDKTYSKATRFAFWNGWVFHVGLAITVFAFRPHMLFVKELTGLSWPTLPSGLVYAVGAITMVSLAAALVRRLTNPVQRFISTFDDYATWVITMLPVLTGLLAVAHVGLRYETMLALHILSVALFMIWLPFGKLAHAFIVFLSRGNTGAALDRRGVQA